MLVNGVALNGQTFGFGARTGFDYIHRGMGVMLLHGANSFKASHQGSAWACKDLFERLAGHLPVTMN